MSQKSIHNKTSDLCDKDRLVIATHLDDESTGCRISIVEHIKMGSNVKVILLKRSSLFGSKIRIGEKSMSWIK
jgi:LmbE family N-acetylglucosaminyl deacetylase